ncbi:septum formation family protein [Amycolatopsis anabasis]|uniref:septum formation family protein n=1 Tax=Amycolatopsis anabasis TaxID=1840409 RepID=UPI00131DFC01|nr:septum formation family protein [Amycolatopsis anabasis]
MGTESGPGAVGGRTRLRRVSAAAAVLALLLTGCAAGGHEDDDHASSDAGPAVGPVTGESTERVKLTELRPETCFTQDRLPDQDGMIQLVRCTGPHKYRTYAVSAVPPELRTDAFPGAEKVEQAALDFCDAEYAKLFHGRPGSEGRPVQYASYAVDEDQWRRGGKMIVCATAHFLPGA